MKCFEVFKGSTTYMSTTSIEAVPFESLQSMQKAGYRFRLDGKVASIKDVMRLKEPAQEPSYQRVFDVIIQKDDGTLEEAKAVATFEDVDSKPVTVTEPTKPVQSSEESVAQPSKPAREGRAKKRVFCPETGVLYNSMTEAGKALGLDPASVSYAASNGRASKGYHFEIRLD